MAFVMVIVSSPDLWATSNIKVRYENYRWRNDDGGEASATWKAGEKVPINNMDTAQTIRLRYAMRNNHFNQSASGNSYLRYSEKRLGAAKIAINPYADNQAFRIVQSPYLINQEATTEQLYAVSYYTFKPGKCVDSIPNAAYAYVGQNQFTEHEFCFQATSRAIPGQTYYFTMWDDDETDSTYSNTASLTMKSLAGMPNVQDLVEVDSIMRTNYSSSTGAYVDFDYMKRTGFMTFARWNMNPPAPPASLSPAVAEFDTIGATDHYGGTIYPTLISNKFWSISEGSIGFGNSFTLCLPIAGITGIPDFTQAVIVTRLNEHSPWTPLNSVYLDSGYVQASDLTQFGQFAIAGTDCLHPVSFSKETISPTSTMVWWHQTNASTEWDLQYDTLGFVSGTGNMVNGLTDTTYTFNNLTPGYYDCYVRTKCDANTSSDWFGPHTIKVIEIPTQQASGIQVLSMTSSSMQLVWNSGNGDSCAVFMSTANTGTANPGINQYYEANDHFQAGDQIGNSGWYCVYRGTDTTTTVFDLVGSTQYRVHVCEFNYGSLLYNTNSETLNPINSLETPAQIFVDADVTTGNQDGTSWANAYQYLQDALHEPGLAAGREIWVAEGVYYPTEDNDAIYGDNATALSQSESFLPIDSVAIYGGFAGTETLLSERDWHTNITILSGDISQDDPNTDGNFITESASDVVGNNTHVLVKMTANTSSFSAATIIDGFSLTGGKGSNGGGAISCTSSNGFEAAPTIKNCRFIGNQTTSEGGALFFENANPKISHCTFFGNYASVYGGAILMYKGSLDISNCSFSNNRADYGGAIAFSASTGSALVEISSCSFYNNIAIKGGALSFETSGGTLQVDLENSILYGNSSSSTGNQIYNDGASVNISHCLLEEEPSASNCGTACTENGNSNIIDEDPLFVHPEGNNLKVYAGSPVINAGDNTANTYEFDLAGNERVQGSDIDMGAYEGAVPIIYVNAAQSDDSGDGYSWATAKKYLQSGLALATESREVWVAQGVYYPDQGTGVTNNDPTASFELVDGLKLLGGFNGTETEADERRWYFYHTILSGDIDNNDLNNDSNYVAENANMIVGTNAHHVVIADGTGSGNITASTWIDGFTITAGKTDNQSITDYKGGGILCDGSGVGNESSPTISNCYIVGNDAGSGGGIMCQAEGGKSNPEIIYCGFIGNTAGYGGALVLDGTNSGEASPNIINCTFTNNEGGQGAGALTIDGHQGTSSPGIINSILWGNTMSAFPSEVVYYNGTPSFSYSNIQGSGGSSGWGATYGLDGGNNIDVDPMFIQLDSLDIRLYKTSPCFEVGTAAAHDRKRDLWWVYRYNNDSVSMGAIQGAYRLSPATQVRDVIAIHTYNNEMEITWDYWGNGDSVCVFMKKAQIIFSGTRCNPTDSVCYMPDTVFGMGDEIETYGWYSVFRGVGEDTITVTGLEKNTNYYVHAVEFNHKENHYPYYNSEQGTNNPLLNSTANGTNPTVAAVIGPDQTSCWDKRPSYIEATTNAQGGSGTLLHQFEISTESDTSGFTVIPGATYTYPAYVPELTNAESWFRMRSKSETEIDWSEGLYSNVVHVDYHPEFFRGQIESDGEVLCEGESPSSISSLVEASGGDGIISYKWQSSTNSYHWTDIADSDSASYIPPANLTVNTWYRRLQTDSACFGWKNTTNNDSYKLSIIHGINPGYIATIGETLCFNGDPAEISSSVAATTDEGGVFYKWERSTDNFATLGIEIPGADSSAYDPPAGITETTWYRRLAKDTMCSLDFVASVGVWKVTVRPLPALSCPGDQFLAPDASVVDLTSLGASPSDGSFSGQAVSSGVPTMPIGYCNSGYSANYEYITLVDFTSLNVSHSSAFEGWLIYTNTILSTLTPGEIYPMEVTLASNQAITPGGVTVYCDWNRNGTFESDEHVYFGSQTIYYPNTVTLSANISVPASAVPGETLMRVILDQNGFSGIDACTNGTYGETEDYKILISGPTSTFEPSELVMGSNTITYSYTDPTTGCSDSCQFDITVYNDFSAGEIDSTGETICSGADPSLIGSVSVASGGDETFTYKWESSLDGFATAGLVINGATSLSYDPPAGLTETTSYRRYAHDASYNDTFQVSAGTWLVTIEPTPIAGTFTKTPDNSQVCMGDDVSAVFAAGSGGNGTDEIEFRTNNGTSWTNWDTYISGDTISTSGLTGVEIRTRRMASYCSNSDYNSVSWGVWALPTVSCPSDQDVCVDGEVVDLTGLGASQQGTGTYTGTGVSGSVFTPSTASIGSHVINYSFTDGNGCKDDCDFLINVKALPTVSAGIDMTVGTTGSYLNATVTDAASLSWTTYGDGTFDFTNTEDPFYSPGTADLAAGSVVLQLSVYPANSPCQTIVSDQVILYFDQACPHIYVDDTYQVCASGSCHFSAVSVFNESELIWSTDGDGTFDNPYIDNPVYTPGIQDIANGTISIMVVAAPISPCVSFDQKLIALNVVPDPIVVPGNELTICQTGASLSGFTASNYSSLNWTTMGDGTFEWGFCEPLGTEQFGLPGITSFVLGAISNPSGFDGNGYGDYRNMVTMVVPGQSYSVEWESDIVLGVASIWVDWNGDMDFDDSGEELTTNLTSAAGSYSISVPYLNTSITAGEKRLRIRVRSVLQPDAGACGDYAIWGETEDYTLYLDGQNATIYHPQYIPGPNDISNGTVDVCLNATAVSPCTSSQQECATLTINNSPMAIAGCTGFPAETCAETAIQLCGAGIAYSSVEWIGGMGTFSSRTEMNPIYTPSASETNDTIEFKLVAYPVTPCSSPDTNITKLIVKPLPTVDAGNYGTICIGETFAVEGDTAYNHSSVLWTTDGSGSFDAPSALHPVYTPSLADITAGTVELSLTVEASSPCSQQATSTLTLDFHPEPAVIFEANNVPFYGGAQLDYLYSEDITVKVNDIMVVNGPVDLAWTVNGTPDSKTGAAEGDVLFSGQKAPGTYIVNITSIVDENGCSPASYTAYNCTITVHPEPAVIFEANNVPFYGGAQLDYCYNEDITVKVNDIMYVNGPVDLAWTVNGTPDSKTGAVEGDVLFTGTKPAGEYIVNITSIVDENGYSPASYTAYNCTITVHPEPAVIFEANDVAFYGGAQLDYCYNEDITVKVNDIMNVNGPVDLAWTVNGTPDSKTGAAEGDVLFTGTKPAGEYIVNITSIVDENGCSPASYTAYNCTITVHPEPAVIFEENGTPFYGGAQLEYCYNEDITVKVNDIMVVDGPVDLAWTVNGTPDSKTGAVEGDVLFTGTKPAGEYIVNITSIVDENGCSPASYTAYNCTITVHPEPAVIFEANEVAFYGGAQLEYCYNEDITVKVNDIVNVNGPVDLAWTVNGTPDSKTGAAEGDVLFTGTKPVGEYIVNITSIVDENGCSPASYTAYNCTITVHPEPAVIFEENGTPFYGGAQLEYCYNEDITVKVNDIMVVDGPVDLAWTVNGTPDSKTGAVEGDVLFTGTKPAGEYIVNITSIVDENGCSPASYTAYNCTITVHPEPAVIFEANEVAFYGGAQLDYCYNEDITVKVNDIVNVNGPVDLAWTVNGTPDSKTGAAEGDVLFTGTKPVGEYIVNITSIVDENGCSPASYTAYNCTITVHPEPAVIFEANNVPFYGGAQLEYCYNEDITVKVNDIMVVDGPVDLAWTVNGTPDSKTGAVEGDVLFTGTKPAGEYIVNITSIVDENGCSPASYTAYNCTITVHPEPAVIFEANNVPFYGGAQLEYCYNEDITVKVNDIMVVDGPVDLAWTVNGTPDSKTGAVEGDVLFTGTKPAGEYIVNITSIVDENGCSPASYTAYNCTITVHPEPAVIFEANEVAFYGGAQLEYCYNEDITVKVNDIMNVNGPVDLAWTVNGTPDSKTGAVEGDVLFTGTKPAGEYIVNITSIVDENGCSPASYTAYNCTITVNEEPMVSFDFNGYEINPSENVDYCEGDDVTVKIMNYYGGTAPYDIEFSVTGPSSWNDTGDDVVTGTELFNSNTLAPGVYTVAVTSLVDANGCPASATNLALMSGSVTINAKPVVSDFGMVSSLDGQSWDALVGSYANGFNLCPDGNSQTHYMLNVANFSANVALEANEMNEFFLDVTSVGTDYYPYWANRGVDANATGGWEAIMWQIINGNAPIAYLVFDGTDYMLVDGLQYQYAQQVLPLVLPGDYPHANYKFDGTLLSDEGCAGEEFSMYLRTGGPELQLSAAGYTIDNGMIYVMDPNIVLQAAVQNPIAPAYAWNTGSTQQILPVSDFGTYTVTATDMGCQAVASVEVSEIQEIELHDGWGWFSTYINTTADFNTLMADLMGADFFLKDQAGNSFFNIFGVTANGLPPHEVGKAYQYLLLTPETLVVYGSAVAPETVPVSLDAGWNSLGYLRKATAPVADMMSPVLDDLELLKDETGLTYWPLRDPNTGSIYYIIDDIHNIAAGDGFQIKMLGASTLTYPANAVSFAKASGFNPVTFNFGTKDATGNNMTLGIPETAWEDLEVANGDEVGIFSSTGQLVGSGVYENDHMAISLWGDDELDDQQQGLVNGEMYTIKLWNSRTDKVSTLEVTEWTEGDGTYGDNATAIVGKLAIQIDSDLTLGTYPNPFSDVATIEFSIPEDGKVKVELLNAAGKLVEVLADREYVAGEHTLTLKANDLAIGNYFIRLTNNDQTVNTAVQLVK